MAIAYVTSTSSTAGKFGTTGTSLTYALTVSGSNTALIVLAAIDGSNADSITGVTYAGTPMTRITSVGADGGGAAKTFTEVYFLANPTAGSNNVVVSASSSVRISSVAALYSGVLASGIPNSFNSGTNADNLTLSTTTTVDNCWTIIAGNCISNVSAGSGTLARQFFSGLFLGDSNAALTPAGSKSMTVNNPSFNGSLGGIIISLPPVTTTTYTRSITVTATATATIKRKLFSRITVTATALATIAKARIYTHLISVAASAQSSILKAVTYHRTISVTATASAFVSQVVQLISRALPKHAARRTQSHQPQGNSKITKPSGTAKHDKPQL